MLPIIALIGRPNVGKSSLFNRLVRQNKSITHDVAGVTRDRVYGEMLEGETRAAGCGCATLAAEDAAAGEAARTA